jgi:hypothetical protein
MTKFVGKVLVTYEIEADDVDKAYNFLYYDTEHPIFPFHIGACVDDEIVSIEEASDD